MGRVMKRGVLQNTGSCLQHRIKISNRRATQRCNVSAFFYAKICSLLARRRSNQPVQRVYWPENVIDWLGKWRPTCVIRHARGQKLQSFRRKWPFYMAARIITGKTYDIRSSEILENLGWQTLLERRQSKKALFMHKIRNNDGLPEGLTSMFTTTNNSNYNLRSNEIDFAMSKPNTNYLKKSFSYSGASFWNSLPKKAKLNHLSRGEFRAILSSSK